MDTNILIDAITKAAVKLDQASTDIDWHANNLHRSVQSLVLTKTPKAADEEGRCEESRARLAELEAAATNE